MYSPNGQFGLNMYNSFFPSDMGGPFGYQGYPLPSPYAFPATHSYGKRKYRKKKSIKRKISKKKSIRKRRYSRC